MPSKEISINLPEEVYQKLEERVKKTNEFKSLEEYIVYVLKQVVEKLSEEEQEDVYSPEEEEEVKKRLKDLGYLE